MDFKDKLKVEKEEVEHSISLIVQQLNNIQDKDVIEFSKLPEEQRKRLRNFALMELTDDLRDNNFCKCEIENSLKEIEAR